MLPYKHNKDLIKCPPPSINMGSYDPYKNTSHFYNYDKGDSYVARTNLIELDVDVGSNTTFVRVRDKSGIYRRFKELDQPVLTIDQIIETFNKIERMLNLKAFL